MSHLKDRYLSTYTGKKFYPYDPRPEQICIEDIAHGLSMLCRFAGQCRFFFSVAEHSIAVAHLLPANLKLFGLLHDVSEAYLADLPRPVKGRAAGSQSRSPSAFERRSIFVHRSPAVLRRFRERVFG